MSLEEIKGKALELKDLRDRKDTLSNELKDINESIREIEEHRLSSLMDDEGISDITIDDVRVRRGVIFRGGITTSTDADNFKFLFDTNNDQALKKKLVIDIEGVDPSVLETIKETMGLLKVDYEITYSIHHMTLSSILKELVTEGKLSTEDFDRFRIYAQPQIKVEMK
jgi:hypothetical protein